MLAPIKSLICALALVLIVVLGSVSFTDAQIVFTTAAPPTTTYVYKPVCRIYFSTEFAPIDGGTAPGAVGTFIDQQTFASFLAGKIGVSSDRILLLVAQINDDRTAKQTIVPVQFMPLATPAPGSFSLTTTAAAGSTTVAPMTEVEVAQMFRRELIKAGPSYLTPYSPTRVEFEDTPDETLPPPTQEVYTPVPTINPEAGNSTSFVTENEANAQIIAIVCSVIFGVIVLVGGVLALKSYLENKKFAKPTGSAKWGGAGRSGDYI